MTDKAPQLVDIRTYTPQAKHAVRKELDAHMQDFFAAGGKVETVPLRELDYDALRRSIGWDYQARFGQDWLRSSV